MQNEKFDIIKSALLTIRRPKGDYSAIPHRQFLWLFFLYSHITTQLSLMILHRVNSKVAIDIPNALRVKPEAFVTEAAKWGQDLSWEILADAFSILQDVTLVSALMDIKLEARYLEAELARRIEALPLTNDFVRLQWESAGWERDNLVPHIEKSLKIDTVDTEPTRNESGWDTKQTAWEIALTQFEKNDDDQPRLPSLPALPIPMSAFEQAMWEGAMTILWNNEIPKKIGHLALILEGKKESIGDTLRHYVVTGEETATRGARRRKAILRKRNAGAESAIEDLVGNRKAKEDLVSIARAKWGKKPAQALEYVVMEGKTEKEAASLANVPYDSVRRYMSKLKKLGNKPK
jgi:hypothetical protein